MPVLDYGVDLTIRAVDEANGFVDAGVLFDVQLKSTTLTLAADPESLGYDLRVSEYDRLRRSDGPVPRILVVLELPPDEAMWLTQSGEELILRRAAYWISLRGLPAVASTTTTRIRLPRTNLFDAAAVANLFALIRSGGPL